MSQCNRFDKCGQYSATTGLNVSGEIEGLCGTVEFSNINDLACGTDRLNNHILE